MRSDFCSLPTYLLGGRASQIWRSALPGTQISRFARVDTALRVEGDLE
jgi:hypothetical protein